MTLLSFCACGLGAFGPAAVLFFSIVAPRPQLVLLCIGSAFFWLVAALLAGSFWLASPTVAGIIAISVLLQECGRALFYLLFLHFIYRMELILLGELKKGCSLPVHNYFLSIDSFMPFLLALVSVCGLVMYMSTLAASFEPAVSFSPSCPTFSLDFIYVVWMMLGFYSMEQLSYLVMGWITLSHLLASYSTMLNNSELSLGCVGAVFVPFLLLLASCALLYHLLRTRTTIHPLPQLVPQIAPVSST